MGKVHVHKCVSRYVGVPGESYSHQHVQKRARNSMQKYNFYEFSGFQLIEKLQKNGNAPVDFSTRTKKSLAGVIKSVDAHNDNALFYQTKKCLEGMTIAEGAESDIFRSIVSDWNYNSLKNILIYIDFSGVFPLERYASRKFHWTKKTPEDQKKEDIKVCERITESFFMKGFDILFDGEKDAVHFVPFEKSSSMARTAAMIFIDSRLYQRMEQRIHLGFNFSGDKVSASKLYSYTGLYLSDGKRITETPEFILNEETVLVLADNVPKDKRNKKKRIAVPIEVISGDEELVSEEGGFQKWPVRKYAAGEYTTSVNYFDGEGIISPEYCAAINDILHCKYGMTGTAASLQIRMPFTKGMLHQVDFRKFICEKLHLKSCQDVRIKDAYGHSRSLEKVQIILTQSMFKIDKWLTNEKISSLEPGADPMALYFNRFHKYNHAFYVGITDMNLLQAGKTKLNYQFLNTLALSDKELEEITDEQIGLVKSCKPKDLLADIVYESIPDGDTSFDDAVPDNETWCVVAGRNHAFLKDPQVKGKMSGVRYSLLKDVGRGRITVEGSTKFLSRDLMALLLFMIGKINACNTVSEEQKQHARDEIRKEQLWTTRFFVADCIPDNPVFTGEGRKLRLHSKAYYGLLRSPHLSRNEQCSLSPYIPHEDDVYSRYFGHLKGILMVPQFSFVPQALGGADFDGDMVKLITDKRINRAINETCYYEDMEKCGKKHVRRLPVVMIPDTPPRTILLPESGVDFQTLKDTFSSKVGELSNCAFYYGKLEYDEKNPNPEFDLMCETGTILVGLEIDAAKTGRHPFLEDYFSKKTEKDYFIARKEEIDKLPEYIYFDVKEYPETKDTVGNVYRHRLSAVTKYGPNTGDELMNGVFIDDYDDYHRIDRLPHRFLRELSAYKASAATEDNNTDTRFAFEKEADWKKQVSDPDATILVKELIYSYRKILDTARKLFHIEERLKKSNYVGCINTIFKIQHKGLVNDIQLVDLQEEIFSQLLSTFESYKTTEKALNKLVKDNHWQFCENDTEKNGYIESTLFADSDMKLSEEARRALYNFRWNGYFLLYYYIKDIMLYYYDAEYELRITHGEDRSSLSQQPARFYEEFRQIFIKALEEKESRKVWNQRIIERCRCILHEEFPDQVDLAIMYTHKLRNCDPYGTFFWDVFTANEILHKSKGVLHAK